MSSAQRTSRDRAFLKPGPRHPISLCLEGDLRVCGWGGGGRAGPPPVALLLVQLQLVLVDVELFNEGIPVGTAQVLVRVVQKELVVQFFLPPPQLATGGVKFLLAFLEGRGEDHLW